MLCAIGALDCCGGASCRQAKGFDRHNSPCRQDARSIHAGLEVFRNFEPDANDFAEFSKTKLVAIQVNGIIIKGSARWLMEYAPSQVIPRLVSFINEAPEPVSNPPLTPR
jgi:hypothetical protein